MSPLANALIAVLVNSSGLPTMGRGLVTFTHCSGSSAALTGK
jgi:hypothetical protein